MTTIMNEEQQQQAMDVRDAGDAYQGVPLGHPDRVKESQLNFLGNLLAQTGEEFDADDPRLTNKWFVSMLINERISGRSPNAEDVGGILSHAVARASAQPAK